MESNKKMPDIDKYWDLKTSLEEEKLLKNEGEEAWFQYIRTLKENTVSPGFEKRVQPHLREPRYRMLLKLNPLFLKAASVTLIAFSAFIYGFYQSEGYKTNDSIYSDTFSSPEEAFEYSAKILQNISGRINSGNDKVLGELKKIKNINSNKK